jgi:hypothetical protein
LNGEFHCAGGREGDWLYVSSLGANVGFRLYPYIFYIKPSPSIFIRNQLSCSLEQFAKVALKLLPLMNNYHPLSIFFLMLSYRKDNPS